MSNSKTRGSKRQSTLAATKKAELKALRHDLAILRKKGLFKGFARSAKNTAKNKKLVNDFRDVLAGTARVTKVTKKDALRLQETYNVTIKNGRAITSKQYNIRNGQLYAAGFRNARIIPVNPNDLEGSIYYAFEALKPKAGLAMRTNGYAGYDIYYSPEDMIFALKMDYAGLIKGLQAKNPPRLEIFDPHKTFLEYRKTVVEQREKRKEEKEKKLDRTRKKLRQPGRIDALRRRFTMGDFMDEIDPRIEELRRRFKMGDFMDEIDPE